MYNFSKTSSRSRRRFSL